MKDIEIVVTDIISTAVEIHRELGPGLLESVYKTVLAGRLQRRGLTVRTELVVPFEFDGIRFGDGLRIDLLVERCVVVEVKAAEKIAPVYYRQVLTYLKLMNLRVGLLVNFGGVTLKEGLRRVVNDYKPTAFSPLRINRPGLI